MARTKQTNRKRKAPVDTGADSASEKRKPHRDGDGDGSQPSTSKRSKKECKYGVKCYQKNYGHLLKFSHKHLTELLENWNGEDSLPSDVDAELKSNAKIVLEQLKVLKKQDGSLSSSQETSGKETQRDNSGIASSAQVDLVKADNAEGNRAEPKNLTQMIHEKTKHHGDVQAKLDAAAPYYFFLTSIADSPLTHQEPLSITFTELLDKGLGELQCSLQINFMVELGWLLAQYIFTGNRFKPLTLLYGVEDDDLKERGNYKNWDIKAIHVKPPTAFGHHHTKMSILAYTDGSIRVIVSTANLVESDWENRTQGLWVSPKLPKLPLGADTAAGDSPTLFKTDLLRYLSFYRLPQLQEWISRVRSADFSSVRVCFVASVPGTHYGPDFQHWGLRRLSVLLKNHVVNPNVPQYPWNSWPVIGQFSSIGTLGSDENAWLLSELRSSMNAPSTPLQLSPLKLIYPSLNDVKKSLDGLLGGACLPYQRKVHQKQMWLEKFLHCWKSDSRFRSGAVPHIKSYARISPGNDLLSWFLLTSANLSKAAWGAETKASLPGRGLRILSYEAGVLFLPHFLVNDVVFNVEDSSAKTKDLNIGSGARNEYPAFPLHYDLPLNPYESGDTPWLYDIFSDS